jgi:hypothetical protein
VTGPAPVSILAGKRTGSSLPFQRDPASVARQAVEIGAEMRHERLQPVERASRSKTSASIGHGVGGGEAAGAAAGAFLGGVGMGGAVGAQEEARIARGGGLQQRLPVGLALGDGQAVVMRPDAAGEDVVAVDDQVMRGDRRAQVRPRRSAHRPPHRRW